VSALGYPDVRPVLAKLADLERELVLIGGQAVNFWASVYERRVPALAREGPFTSKDIDFCGDPRAVRRCAQRLNGIARLAGFDDATPNNGTVVFVDGAGVRQTLDIVTAPFGLNAKEVRDTAVPVRLPDALGVPSARPFYVMHPVLSMESRVHNVVGLAGTYDTEQGRKQLRASVVCAHEFIVDILDGRFVSEDPVRTALKLNERILRFCTRDRDARELRRRYTAIDPARALVDDERLPSEFREQRLPQMHEHLAGRAPPSSPKPARPQQLPEIAPKARRDRGPER
jgi:hypothetical protein